MACYFEKQCWVRFAYFLTLIEVLKGMQYEGKVDNTNVSTTSGYVASCICTNLYFSSALMYDLFINVLGSTDRIASNGMMISGYQISKDMKRSPGSI